MDQNRHTEFIKATQLMKRMTLFLLPLGILFLCVQLIIWPSGENWPLKKVVRIQNELSTTTLYNRTLISPQFGIYKLEAIRQRKSTVLALGSSTVMQFRDFMFAPKESLFYNAGGLIENVYELDEFASLIDAGKLPAPKVIILGIDPWWLKSRDSPESSARLSQWDEVYRLAAHSSAFRSIIRERYLDELQSFWQDKSEMSDDVHNIGIKASTHESGFRRDGSWQYSSELFLRFQNDPKFVDREVPPVVSRIRSHSAQFADPNTYSAQRADILCGGVKKLVSKNIEVFAFLPPFSSECREAIRGDGELNALFSKCREELLPQLSLLGVTLVRSDATELPDVYMIDGFHPSEVYVAHILRTLLSEAPPSSLLQQVDREKLKHRIEAAKNPLEFAGPQSSAERDNLERI